MEFVKAVTVSLHETSLVRCQKVQWYASQFSLSFGLLYLSFGAFAADLIFLGMNSPFENRPKFFGGFGLYTGLISIIVAGFGAAAIAPRPGANWNNSKRYIIGAYGICSVHSFCACAVQIGLASYAIFTESDIFTNSTSIESAGGYFVMIPLVSLFGMILTGFINSIADAVSCYHSSKLIQVTK